MSENARKGRVMDKASKRVKRPSLSLRTKVFTKVFIKRLPRPNHVLIVLAKTPAHGIVNLSMKCGEVHLQK